LIGFWRPVSSSIWTEKCGPSSRRRLVGALGPGVDDLVVLLALGDQAVIVLLLVFLDESVAVSSTSFSLVSGMTMSSLPKEMPALQAFLKPSP
jgi:hypothetical protein